MADPITNTQVIDTSRADHAGWDQGVREDLANIISRISPTDTPFMSMCDKGGCKSIQFDWLVQELADPDVTNDNPEGFEAEFDALDNPVRLYNICQLADKTAIVSDTMDAVDTAGRARESAYQIVLKGLELRRDLENIALQLDQAKALETGGGANRKMASLGTWITNCSVGATTGAAPTGDGTDGPTAGDLRALTLTLIDDALELAYTEGGNPTIMMMGPPVRRKFSTLSGLNINQANMSASSPVPNATVGTVAIFLSDFGRMEVVMNRWMPAASMYLLDKEYLRCDTLPGRAYKRTPLAKTGSATKHLVEWEGALRIRAPKAHAAVYDINPAL